MIYWQISFEKYVPNNLIRLLYNFYFFFRCRYLIIKKKTNSENVSNPKVGVLNIEFALKLRIYRSLESFIRLKWIRKKLSPTLYTQFTSRSRSLPLRDWQLNSKDVATWCAGVGIDLWKRLLIFDRIILRSVYHLNNLLKKIIFI